MIPEQAKSEIIRKHAMGETWTAIRNWLEEEYGVRVHRTTISRWHAKEVYSRPINEEEEIEIEINLSEDDRIKFCLIGLSLLPKASYLACWRQSRFANISEGCRIRRVNSVSKIVFINDSIIKK